jgi:hypothetical protein
MSKSTFASMVGRRTATKAFSAAVTAIALLAMAAPVMAYPAKIKNACRSDYNRFCPRLGEDSAALKACMRSAGGNISVKCRNALADGGYIPRKYHSSQLGH